MIFWNETLTFYKSFKPIQFLLSLEVFPHPQQPRSKHTVSHLKQNSWINLENEIIK